MRQEREFEMNETAIATKQNTRLAKKIFSALAAVMTAVYWTMFSAFAFGQNVTVNTTAEPQADQLMGNIIGILLTITRFVGVALVIYGVYEIVMSFMQNQPEAKTKGIIMALAGVVMIALKSIISGLGIIS